MSAKYTPGPWEFTNYTKLDGSPILTVADVAEVTAASARRSEVAELWGVSMPGPDGPVICYTGNGPTSQENARLIAAAPELLEALRSLRLECLADVLNPCFDNRATDKPGWHWGSTKTDPIAACSSCVARAAIAKAEGRTA